MNVSIVGAGRTRNGIGEYIGKYFRQHGGEVTSVLGTTEETSVRAASALRKYGIEAQAYTDFDAMVGAQRPDVVVIASPASTHYDYLLKCLDRGLHVFCEKPFLWDDGLDVRKRIEDIFEKARKKRLTVAMNSQWPFSLDAYEALCGEIRVKETKSFFARMSPFSPGRVMIPESIPHPLSILYCRLGPGEVKHLEFEWDGKGQMNVRFTYRFETQACDVLIKLVQQKNPPREFSFGFNEKIVSRSLDLTHYDIYFSYQDKTSRVVDPLNHSVKNFIEAVENGTDPLIGPPHILHNTVLLKQIDDGFGEFEKRNLWIS